MSLVESLHSEPEIISSESTEKTFVCSCKCHEKEIDSEDKQTETEESEEEKEEEEEPIFSVIENTNIFAVTIDGKLSFYCETFDDAVDQATDYLRNICGDWVDNEYYLERDGNIIRLTSTYRWFLVQYDRVESVAEISEVSRIKFTKTEEKVEVDDD